MKTLLILTLLTLGGCASVDTSNWTPEQKRAYYQQLDCEMRDIGLHMMMTQPVMGAGSVPH
jgi:uncharacterized protein YceK